MAVPGGDEKHVMRFSSPYFENADLSGLVVAPRHSDI
jgi:hypothetical protein